MKILMIELEEIDDRITQELVTFFSERAQCKILDTFPLQSERRQSNMIFPGLEIYQNEQTVYQNKELIHLSRFEFFTLCYLAKHPGWVFSKEQIYEAVWNEAGEHCGTAVTNVISQIRRKLNQQNDKEGYIRTVINRGYKFVIDN